MFVWSWRNLKHQKCFQITERLNFLKWKRHNFLTATQENTMNIIACVVDTFEISLSNCWWKMKRCANYIVHMNFDRNMVPHYGSVSLTVMKILYQHKNCWWKYAVHLRPVHVLLSRFYLNFILILSQFYSHFISILSWIWIK